MCVVHYMCLCCSIDLVSICANKEIYKEIYNNSHRFDKFIKKRTPEVKIFPIPMKLYSITEREMVTYYTILFM